MIVMAAPALAHHSFAVYDHTRTLTLSGSVTKFQWTNPHAFIEMDVTQSDGSVKHYSVELTSINMMQRVGWRSNMIKPGDKVKVVMAPLLSGEPVGLGLEVVLAASGFPARARLRAASEFIQIRFLTPINCLSNKAGSNFIREAVFMFVTESPKPWKIRLIKLSPNFFKRRRNRAFRSVRLRRVFCSFSRFSRLRIFWL
jgi:hypothetical protein